MIQKLDKNRAHSLRIAKIRELTKIRQNNIEPSARVDYDKKCEKVEII